MDKPLVSILTPCYNTGKYVSRLLDSVLNQDYENIEMCAIDDGSTDNTAEVIKSYIPKFERRGYSLTYIYQPNQGQSVAINNGLKLVSGKYLTWPDSDDYYAVSDAVSVFVNVLENLSQNTAVVRCWECVVTDDDRCSRMIMKPTHADDRYLFSDCLFCRNGFYFPPGGYFFRFNAIKEEVGLNIYTEKNAGQNWQLYLPILYKYSLYTIPRVLFCVVERRNSHSRGQFSTYSQQMERLSSYERTICHTLRRIPHLPDDLLERLLEDVKVKCLKQRMQCSFQFCVPSSFRQYAVEYKTHFGALPHPYVWIFFFSYIPGCFRFLLYGVPLFRSYQKIISLWR